MRVVCSERGEGDIDRIRVEFACSDLQTRGRLIALTLKRQGLKQLSRRHHCFLGEKHCLNSSLEEWTPKIRLDPEIPSSSTQAALCAPLIGCHSISSKAS
ncbi:hypothetical protein TNCT_633471 [Trichonephila clavata]|uniref:Uncharacterized protein n=1 Tax=Trichonephila clavata TaxID=2740835 RepID=A0A8X6LZD9_TRICU|nr:hypothetical protein TNCT_633471 [Trichonephila clavata]